MIIPIKSIFNPLSDKWKESKLVYFCESNSENIVDLIFRKSYQKSFSTYSELKDIPNFVNGDG